MKLLSGDPISHSARMRMRIYLQLVSRAAAGVFLLTVVFANQVYCAPLGDGLLARRVLLGAAIADAPETGVKVLSVIAGGAAANAHLASGDIITAVGTAPVGRMADLFAILKRGSAEPTSVVILRSGVKLVLTIVPTAAPVEEESGLEVYYDAVLADGTLRRVLVTVPTGTQRPKMPAALIVGGIGCYTIDNASDKEDAYMRLAHALAQRGIVSLRLEKSGVGDSQGSPCGTVDLSSETHSYEVALDSLRNNPFVDSQQLFLIGHSIGVSIVPQLASRPGVQGIIAMDGVGRNWLEYELLNLRRQLTLEGMAPGEIDARLAEKERCAHRLLVQRESELTIEKADASCAQHNLYPVAVAYIQQAAELNVGEMWSKVAVPTLVVYGTADFVTDEEDHHRIASIVNSLHQGNATLTLIPGMDHHLDVAGSQQEAFNLRVLRHTAGPFDEQLSTAVTSWLCQRVACRGTASQ